MEIQSIELRFVTRRLAPAAQGGHNGDAILEHMDRVLLALKDMR